MAAAKDSLRPVTEERTAAGCCPTERTMDGALGIELLEAGEELAAAASR